MTIFNFSIFMKEAALAYHKDGKIGISINKPLKDGYLNGSTRKTNPISTSTT